MIRVAIIGTGSIAAAHLEAYGMFAERCRVVALVNNREQAALELKEKFQLDCRVLTDYKQLLQGDQVDLVSICTPPFLHADMTVDALRAGVHVLVEKPMALSLEECDRMLAAAEQSGSLLSVVGQNRFLDSSLQLKRTVDSGLLGDIVYAKADCFWWRGESYYDMWWRGTWEREGGGCTINHGVHHIDMLIWMIGLPQTVQAVMGNASHSNSEVEDLSLAILTYPNGALAQIASSVVHHGEERELAFQGRQAGVAMPWKVRASVQTDAGFPQRNPELEEAIERHARMTEPLVHTGHAGQIDDVLCAIESGELKASIDGREGRKAIELVTAIYEAAVTRRPVELPLTEQSDFYSRAKLLANVPRFHVKPNSAATQGTLS